MYSPLSVTCLKAPNTKLEIKTRNAFAANTHSTVRREKYKFGRLRHRPRGLYRDDIQADIAVRKSDRSHCSVVEDTTRTPIFRGVGHSVLYSNFWRPLGRERADWDEAILRGQDYEVRSIGEIELVAHTMLATSVTFVEALSAFLSNTFGQSTNLPTLG
jgi:hypothetical protein